MTQVRDTFTVRTLDTFSIPNSSPFETAPLSLAPIEHSSDSAEPERPISDRQTDGQTDGQPDHATDLGAVGAGHADDGAEGRKRRRRGTRRRRDAPETPEGDREESTQEPTRTPNASATESNATTSAGDATSTSVRGILDLDGGKGAGKSPNSADHRLRQLADGLVEGANDPFVPVDLVQRHGLRSSVRLEATARTERSSGRLIVDEITSIEGLTPAEFAARRAFADLTPLDPAPRMTLEHRGCPPACRLIDLFCPIGFGTRGLIVAPPKAGKTVLLQNIAFGIKHNHPDVELVALLIDERPEEVTDFKRNVPAHVLASSNDQDLDRHLSLGILAIERAKRMVEAGKNVVVLLDSLTRLGRAFNNSRKYGSSGRTMSGGLDSRALEVPKQLFGAARRAEEGGSLTIIATCLVDTGSRADQIIFEEFKGTGNMELILDREISEKRIFPAINLAASGTRKEHLLLSEQALKTITALRRRLLSVPPHVQIEQLLGALNRFETNDRLVAG